MNLTAPRRLLLVHAHPDDESLWTGGTIARYAAYGVHVTVVTCTLGEEGEIIPDGLRGLGVAEADQLGGYRVSELRSACAALGVVDQRFLGGAGRWRDSGMAGSPARAHPRAFIAGNQDDQIAALVAILREVKPQVVVTYQADGGYGHPDHIRTHELTMAAAADVDDIERIFYTVASTSAVQMGLKELADQEALPFSLPAALPGVPDELITTIINVSAHLPAKLNALRAHATQVQVWQGPDGTAAYALSNGLAQPVLDVEHFVLAQGDSSGISIDLFGGQVISAEDGENCR